MKCPYLQGQYLQSCVASREVYVPSEFEFREYCTHSGHKICPLYFRSEYAGMPTASIIAKKAFPQTA